MIDTLMVKTSKYVKGVKFHQQTPKMATATKTTLSALLEERTGSMFFPYYATYIGKDYYGRINKSAICSDLQITVTAKIFDLDTPKHNALSLNPEWLKEQMELLKKIDIHFVYTTKNGIRFGKVYHDRPNGYDHQVNMRKEIKGLHALGINVDPLWDWTRMFRSPLPESVVRTY